MQGLITLDFGNTNPHAGLFQKTKDSWNLIKVVPWTELPIFLTQIGLNSTNSTLVLCEVKSREEELMPFLQQGFLLTRIKDYWRGEKFAGMPVHYTKTLGEDRLITAYYTYKKNKVPTLLIDAGTFITMDIINENGFQGGYIIPGIETYFSGFAKGEQLRDVKLAPDFTPGLPQNTTDAMINGYQAFAAFAQELTHKHKIKRVVLTGGKASIWQSFFLNLDGAVVETEPHLLHLALQYWMTTQIEPS